MALRTRDAEALLAFVAHAHDHQGPEALSSELLDELTVLVGCDYATYQEFDFPRRVVTAYIPCANEGTRAVPPPYVPASLWRGEPPHWNAHVAALQKLSDGADRRERERLRDVEEYNAEFRIVDTLQIRVGERRTRYGVLRFDSRGRDFDDRDRALALTLRPHVEALRRKALSRRQLAELLGEIDRHCETSHTAAIVLFTAGGRIDHATAEARRLLAAWFGGPTGRLPREIFEWANVARPGERLTARRTESALTVEAAGDFTLTLRETRSTKVALTPREREALGLVAEGLTNAEIARRLWIGPSTVAKHLEHAYRKLGVHSRTAAVSRLTKLRP